MFKPTRNIYTIKTSPYNDNEKLENLLNEMSLGGWDLYSMQELENDDEVYYNCIFIKEVENENEKYDETAELLNFKPRIERIINPDLEPYEQCLDILKKIKEKRQKISHVKSLIDGTSEDSRTVLNEEISRHINELDVLKKNLSDVINPNIMEKKLGEAKLTLAISEELADISDCDSDDNILSQLIYIRQNLTETLGYIMPTIKIELDESLEENEFLIKVRGIPVVSSFAYCNHTMFLKSELTLEQLPPDTIKSTDKITNLETVWINDEISKDFWTKGLSAVDYIASVIEYCAVKYIDDIFDYADIDRYVDFVSKHNLYLVENIIPEYLSLAELKYILTSLIKEKVSIKDIVFIFEKLNDFIGEKEDDYEEDLLARIRIALARQISASICEEDNTIQAYELSEDSLRLLSFDIEKEEEVIKIESNKISKVLNKVQNKIKTISNGSKELILIAPMELRHIIYLVFSQIFPNIRVVAREELLFEYPLKILGKI